MNQATLDTYLHFLEEILTAIADSDADPQVVYPLLEANLDKLDDNFVQILECWAEENLLQHSKKNIKTALNITFFSFLLENFSLGSVLNNLKIAIAGLKTILTFFDFDTYLDVWIENQYNLGNIYLKYHNCLVQIDRINEEVLEYAIQSYSLVLSVNNIFERSPELWISTLNNLSFAYQERVNGEKFNNLELAIKCCKYALQVRDTQNFKEQWGAVQINLGLLYCKRIKHKHSDNIELAIKHLNFALQVFNIELFPEDWAKIQVNLGVAYRNRIRGNQIDNLEIALRHYYSALKVYSYEKHSDIWANIQNNLGLVYCDRIYGNKEENINKAIFAFQAALKLLRQKNYLKDYADTCHNLGNAYCHRVSRNKSVDIEKAINCFRSALMVRNRKNFANEWANTQNSLACAYIYRLKGNKLENLETATNCYLAALTVHTIESFPYDWAKIQINLGILYLKKAYVNNQAYNFQQAITHSKAALKIFNNYDYPEQWSDIQHNLGLIYGDWGNIEVAIKHFRLALKIYTPTNNPFICRRVGKNFGEIAFEAEKWQEAIEGYEIAIAALEKFRVWTTNEAKRQEILTEDIDLYANIIQAYINSDRLDKAFEYVERSRCRRLVDLMASNDLYAEGEISPEVQTYLRQYDSLQQQIDRERFTNQINLENKQNLVGMGASLQPSLTKPTCDRAAVKAHNEKIATLEAEKQKTWYKIRSLDPVLAGEIQVNSPDLQAVRQLIDGSATAILSFYTTQKDTYIFVVRQDRINCHLCLQPEDDNLQDWIEQNWLTSYLEDKDRWKQQITFLLVELSQRLKLEDLVSKHLKDIEELIIVPHLYLHQIPFATLPLTNDEYLGNRFLLRYVPSCQVLEFCHKRPHISDKLTYGIVENATEDLPCANFEGESIAQLYNIPPERRLQGRDRATVNNYRQMIQQVQAIVSSHHAQSRLDNPLESKLILGDGSITLGQLMTPGWRLPQLTEVFLSCCETNLGVSAIVDDIFTISTGFLCAGARSVISTLWTVDDLATALFSIFYHNYRQERLSRPAAIHKAQIKLRTLTGQILISEYQSQLIPLLDEKFQQTETKRQQAKANRDLEAKDSPAYSQWQEKYKQYYQTAQHIRAVKKNFEHLCQQDYPFEHPVYWAGFICSGLK